MKRKTSAFAWLSAALTLLSATAGGQVRTGLPPFGSFSGGPFDTVNNANLNVHFEIPVVEKSGRQLPFIYRLSYDSAVWYPVGVTGSKVWTPVANWGWRAITEPATGYVSYTVTQQSCGYLGTTYYWNVWSNWKYNDPFGVSHTFPVAVSNWQSGWPCGSGPPASATGTATDGSGYTASVNNVPSAAVTDRSGAKISAPLQSGNGSGTVTDRNGNRITATSNAGTTTFTDTLGTTALTVTGAGTPASPVTLSWTNPVGGTSSVRMNYTAYTVQTSYGCSGISEYGASTQNLVNSISLPDGTSYTFTYESTPGQTEKSPAASRPSRCPPAERSPTPTREAPTASPAPAGPPRP
jgi:hypothetical protein